MFAWEPLEKEENDLTLSPEELIHIIAEHGHLEALFVGEGRRTKLAIVQLTSLSLTEEPPKAMQRIAQSIWQQRLDTHDGPQRRLVFALWPLFGFTFDELVAIAECDDIPHIQREIRRELQGLSRLLREKKYDARTLEFTITRQFVGRATALFLYSFSLRCALITWRWQLQAHTLHGRKWMPTIGPSLGPMVSNCLARDWKLRYYTGHS